MQKSDFYLNKPSLKKKKTIVLTFLEAVHIWKYLNIEMIREEKKIQNMNLPPKFQ